MSFTDKQVKELEKKLDPKNVKARDQNGFKLSYIEGWHAIAEANRIFGFGEWSRDTIELTENTQPTQNHNKNWIVSFRAKVRVDVNGCHRDGIGFGQGIAKDIHAAYESAIKEAETDAMKRALSTFGNQFGLALYDKAQANVGVDCPFNHDSEKRKAWMMTAKDEIEALPDIKSYHAWVTENADRMDALGEKQRECINGLLTEAKAKLEPKKEAA